MLAKPLFLHCVLHASPDKCQLDTAELFSMIDEGKHCVRL